MIFGAVSIVGFQLFNDIHSILFVLGGATGYSFLKSSRNDWVKNIGNGAVYFGWLGTLIGFIAIAGNRFDVWGDMDKMGPALSVAMLTIFYGAKLIPWHLRNNGFFVLLTEVILISSYI